MIHRLVARTLCIALVALGACGEPTRANNSEAGGRVTAVIANPPGTWYPGEIRIQSAQLGEFRAYVFYESTISVRSPSGARRGDFASFVAGDSVLVSYDPTAPVLTSLPPVIGISRFEIRR
jgi:hypothetical protein